MKLLAISGWIGCGKDTVAEYLIKNNGFNRESMARSLKDAASAIFNWDREMLEGATPESREWREKADPWWSEKLGYSISPRLALQNIGTELFREEFHPDIWLLSLETRIIHDTDDSIVITDCRFPNEINMIRRLGGKVIWVQRGPEPNWYNTAIEACRGDKDALAYMIEHGIHASEWRWVDTEFDYIIKNDSTLGELYLNIQNMLKEFSWNS